MPTWFVISLYSSILAMLTVLVRWEYKRAKKRRPMPPLDPFLREP